MKTFIPRYRIYKLRELLAILLFDIVSHIIFIPVKIYHFLIKKRLRDYSENKIRKILIFRTDRIGDLVMTLPAVELLREKYSKSEFHLIAGKWNEPLLKYIKDFDRIEFWSPSWISRGEASDSFFRLFKRAVKLRKEKYDLTIDFTSDIRINLLMWLSGAKRRIGYSDSGGGAFLTETIEELGIHRVKQNFELLKRLGIHENNRKPSLEGTITFDKPIEQKKMVIIHPWGGRPVKTWKTEKYSELARMIHEKLKIDVILTGSEQDCELCAKIKEASKAGVSNMAGRLSFQQMMETIKSAMIFISPDTGPMHIATALGTPTVSLFGPSDAAKYGPYGDPKIHRVIVSKGTKCLFCNKIRKPPVKCFKDGVSLCMDAIRVEDVFAECKALFDQLNNRRRSDGGKK